MTHLADTEQTASAPAVGSLEGWLLEWAGPVRGGGEGRNGHEGDTGNGRVPGTAERRRRWLRATDEITGALMSGADADRALRRIAFGGLELTGADQVLVALPDDPDTDLAEVDALTVRAAAGRSSEGFVGSTVPLLGPLRAVLGEGAPYEAVEVALHTEDGSQVTAGPALVLRLGSSSTSPGLLVVVRKRDAGPVDPAETRLTTAFAAQAARALRHVEGQQAARDLEILAERDRVAADLHDQVIQRLFAVGLAVQSTRLRTRNPTVARRLDQHIDELQDVIGTIRDIIYALPELTTRSVGDTRVRTELFSTIADLTAESALHTSVNMDGPLGTADAALVHDLRAVVGEAVSNAVRHAGATRLDVSVSSDGRCVTVEVTDDGTGIPQDADRRSGLANLRRRAAEHEGRCIVDHPEGGGTRLVWTGLARSVGD